MVAVRLYVEGGGDKRDDDLARRCKQAFSELLSRVTPRRPHVIACGGRQQAYDMFKTALTTHADALNLLLVDSEDKVAAPDAWAHLRARDKWPKLDGQVYLMVQCMEAWILADRANLAAHFGSGFNSSKIPQWPEIEAVSKMALYQALKDASKGSKKGAYDKGRDSFKLLAAVDPKALRAACPSAERFFTAIMSALAP